MAGGRVERCRIVEAGIITGLKPRTLQSLAITGKIPGAAKLGKCWTFNIERLREWVAAQEAETVARAAHADQWRRQPPMKWVLAQPLGMGTAERLKSVTSEKLKAMIAETLRGDRHG